MSTGARASTLEGIIRRHGEHRPDRPLATFDGHTVTYGQVHVRSNRIAQRLLEAGVGVGGRVGLLTTNRTEFFDVLFAARKVGAVLVPINWRLAPPEIEYVLRDSQTEHLFAGGEFVDAVEEARPRLPHLRGVTSLDDGPDGASFDTWLAGGDDVDPGLESGPEDVALQLYTSGTTGHPKGVLLTNRSVFAFYRNAETWISHNPDGVHLNCLPLFHVGGINWSLQALAQGAHVVGFSGFDPDVALMTIESERVTHVMTVPTVIQLLLSRPVARTADLSSVQVVVYGGSPIPEKVLRDAVATFGDSMYGLYGMTEMSFGATLLTPAEHADTDHPERLLSVGRPFAGTQLKVVDIATGLEAPPGEAGELWFRSDQAGIGYWNRPAETAEVFRDDGWYRTGDIGCQIDGYFYVTDRLKDMVISGGENVYPAEVERVLLEHEDVVEAAVFGVPDDRWGESVRAEVVLGPGSEISEQSLLAFVRDRLAHYKCPKQIGFRDELPHNASGKLLRGKLRAEFRTPATA